MYMGEIAGLILIYGKSICHYLFLFFLIRAMNTINKSNETKKIEKN